MMGYGIADCNNFFVSCERVFRPDLEGRPVVVLSNNDGCIVSRSNEAKAMGIPMGLPYFMLSDYDPQGRVAVFSSNFALYADMSSRVMSILRDMVGEVEPYSIDECFFPCGLSGEERGLAETLPARIRQWTGIPVSIGLAPTKTMAKMACRFAKTHKGYRGFCCIDSHEKMRKAAALSDVGEVWGVGRRSAKALAKAGIRTVADFLAAPEGQVRRLMGVNGLRVLGELRGEVCLQDELVDTRKGICTSRSFAKPVSEWVDLRHMVANFATLCASKLRKQNSVACVVGVFVASSRFRQDEGRQGGMQNVVLQEGTSNHIDIVRAAEMAAGRLFRKGEEYKKAGVVLGGISSANSVQRSLFAQDDFDGEQRRRSLSKVVDEINAARGANTVHLASQMVTRGDAKGGDAGGSLLGNIRRDLLSPRYTTDWGDILQVR